MKKKLSVLIVVILFFTACLGNKKNKLNVLFNKVDSLEKGAPVKLHGITIGKVTDLELFKDSVLVEIKLDKGRKIPVGSKFKIINSLIGGPSIIVEPSDQKVFLTLTDTAKGNYETKGLLDAFFTDSLNKQKARDAIEKITKGLKELSEIRKDTGAVK